MKCGVLEKPATTNDNSERRKDSPQTSATEREIRLRTTSKTGRARKVFSTNLGILSPQNQPEI
jgi:hypothetical protein